MVLQFVAANLSNNAMDKTRLESFLVDLVNQKFASRGVVHIEIECDLGLLLICLDENLLATSKRQSVQSI